jgi:ATP diphosphatase
VSQAIHDFLKTVRALRDPKTGCPWDLKQTHASLAQYCLEEAHEVVDAIESGSKPELVEELGDLLLQIVLHAQLLEESGAGDFDKICRAINEKMIERHPHVFKRDASHAGMSADDVVDKWNARKIEKAKEKSATPVTDKLRNMPKHIPALQRAARFGDTLASIGFDWRSPAEVWDKVDEERAELEEAIAKHDEKNIDEELGDLLFVLAQWARLSKRDPEQTLRGALVKFTRRIEFMETNAVRQFGRPLDKLSLEEMETLWDRAKSEKGL